MSLEGLFKYPFAFLFAAIIAYLLTPLCIVIANKLGIVDQPGLRRIHDQPVARAGGVAVFLGLHLTAAFMFLFPWSAQFGGTITHDWWLFLLCSSSFLLIVGLLDDAFQISWLLKLAGQTFAAFLMYEAGISFNSIQGVPIPDWLDLVLTISWFLAFINAFNLIDGLDGLASGLAAIAALGLAAAAIFRGLPTDALLLLALAGACIGFLRYNFHPARIFLGDSGSMLIGFTLAAIGLEGTSKSTTIAAIGVPFLAIGVPIFDVMLAIWRRSIRAYSNRDKLLGKVVQADMEHVHHRLLKAGFTQRKVALSLYALNGLLVGFGILTVIFNSRSTGIFLLAIVVGSYVVVKHLAQLELWDSGTALLSGLRRPRSRMLPVLVYPIVDAGLLLSSLALVLILIFKPTSLSELREIYAMRIPVWCGIPFIIMAFGGIYSRVWSRARPSEFGLLGFTMMGAFVLCLAIRLIMDPRHATTSLLIAFSHGSLSLCLVLGIRTLPRFIQDIMAFAVDPRSKEVDSGSLIYGAGTRGMLYLRRKSYLSAKISERKKILGFIDDEVGLRKRKVHGYLVHGGWDDLTEIIDKLKPKEIIITCEIDSERLNMIYDLCRQKNIKLIEWQVGEKILLDSTTL
jgi:UDP-GlcNAc:undecaprenyl-phosphate GlcNAc-1-phosphate transferase